MGIIDIQYTKFNGKNIVNASELLRPQQQLRHIHRRVWRFALHRGRGGAQGPAGDGSAAVGHGQRQTVLGVPGTSAERWGKLWKNLGKCGENMWKILKNMVKYKEHILKYGEHMDKYGKNTGNIWEKISENTRKIWEKYGNIWQKLGFQKV